VFIELRGNKQIIFHGAEFVCACVCKIQNGMNVQHFVQRNKVVNTKPQFSINVAQNLRVQQDVQWALCPAALLPEL